MYPMPVTFVCTIVALVAGCVLGWLAANRSGTGAGFAALGASAGLMIGMSTSPVVAASVATILGLLTVLVPLYFHDQANRQAAALIAAGKAPPAAALPPLGSWLFPFAGMLLVSLLIGAVIRVNDALRIPSQPPNLADHYSQLGFTSEQVKLIMDGRAKTFAAAQPQTDKPRPEGSVLHDF